MRLFRGPVYIIMLNIILKLVAKYDRKIDIFCITTVCNQEQ